jgi:hypothetical protein
MGNSGWLLVHSKIILMMTSFDVLDLFADLLDQDLHPPTPA